MSHRDEPCRQRGLTLIELSLSLAISGIILLGLVSAILVTTRAVETEPAPTDELTRALDVVLADLRTATTCSERATRALTMTVPDRDGDGDAETIRYAWSGSPGAPLTRVTNGGAAVTVVADVYDLDFDYVTRTTGPPPPPPEVEGPVDVLAFHDLNGGSIGTFAITSSKWCAQYVRPVHPADTVRWKITRILFRPRRTGGSSGNLVVEVRDADGNQKPGAQILESMSIPAADLSDPAVWLEVQPSTLDALDPAEGYCIVLHTDSTSNVASIEFENNGSPMTAGTHWTTSGSSGTNWSNPQDTKDMRFYVYGTVTTQGGS